MKKRPFRLRNMNLFDKAALGAFCVLVGVGIALTQYQNHQPLPKGGEMTVRFSGVGATFGSEIVPGEVVTDHNQEPIGTVLSVERVEDDCFITISTLPEYSGAVGQTLFLRSKHFAGTGQVRSYSLSKGECLHAVG